MNKYYLYNKEREKYFVSLGADGVVVVDDDETKRTPLSIYELSEAFYTFGIHQTQYCQPENWEVKECFWIAKTQDGFYLNDPLSELENLPTSENKEDAGLMNFEEKEQFSAINNAGLYVVELAGPDIFVGPRPKPKP